MPSPAILCEERPISSVPLNFTDPLARGGLIPMIAAHMVVFPIPFRPTTATACSPSSNETFWSTCALP